MTFEIGSNVVLNRLPNVNSGWDKDLTVGKTYKVDSNDNGAFIGIIDDVGSDHLIKEEFFSAAPTQHIHADVIKA